jgi:hypothetical protein
VGELLQDFLNLGCELGYGSIESIHCVDGETLAAYVDQRAIEPEDWGLDEERLNMLRYFRERLNLTPWTDQTKLAPLQQRFGELLRYPPGAVLE